MAKEAKKDPTEMSVEQKLKTFIMSYLRNQDAVFITEIIVVFHFTGDEHICPLADRFRQEKSAGSST
jgi:hypothetical protein